jgi:hypothetical protein
LQIAGLPEEFKGNPFFFKPPEVKQKKPNDGKELLLTLAGRKGRRKT